MSRLHHRLGGAWLVAVLLLLWLFESPAKSEEVSLRLVPASEQELTFHRFINRYDYKPLCDPPCFIELEKTALRLGASLGSRYPVAGNLLQLEGDGRIEVSYRDRRPQRVAGLVVGAVGAVAAFTLLGASLGHAMADDILWPDPGDNRAAEYGIASLGVALSFGAVATYLVLREDVVESVYLPADAPGP